MPYPPTVARADGPADSTSPPVDERFLHEIISTVGSSLELDEVLAAVVDLLSDASAVHACFVYLHDRDGAAPRPPGGVGAVRGLVGQIVLERRGRPRLVGDRAAPGRLHPRQRARRSTREVRPRARGGAVPVARRGPAPRPARRRDRRDHARHRRAARVHGLEVELFVSTASLVAGAIENARLYDEMRQRVAELERLTELAGGGRRDRGRSRRSAGSSSREAARCCPPTRPASTSRDGDAGGLRLRWAEPPGLEGVPADDRARRARPGARTAATARERRRLARRRRRAARGARRDGHAAGSSSPARSRTRRRSR